MLLLAGCPDEVAPPDPDPPAGPYSDDSMYSGSFEEPSENDLTTPSLPPAPGGGFLLMQTSEGRLTYDPELRTPVTAAAGCAALLVACYEPGVRGFLGCLENVRDCDDDTPWDDEGPEYCCESSACPARYRELRDSGLDAARAAVDAILAQPSCMPGVDDYVGSER